MGIGAFSKCTAGVRDDDFEGGDYVEIAGQTGVIKQIPIEVKPRGRLGGIKQTTSGTFSRSRLPIPLALAAAAAKHGSLRSALSIDIENPEFERLRKDYDIFKKSKENEMSAVRRKEKKLESENRRLKAELQAMQKTLQNLRQQRDIAVQAENDARSRASAIETTRNSLQKNFKLYRESKENEIRVLLQNKSPNSTGNTRQSAILNIPGMETPGSQTLSPLASPRRRRRLKTCLNHAPRTQTPRSILVIILSGEKAPDKLETVLTSLQRIALEQRCLLHFLPLAPSAATSKPIESIIKSYFYIVQIHINKVTVIKPEDFKYDLNENSGETTDLKGEDFVEELKANVFDCLEKFGSIEGNCCLDACRICYSFQLDGTVIRDPFGVTLGAILGDGELHHKKVMENVMNFLQKSGPLPPFVITGEEGAGKSRITQDISRANALTFAPPCEFSKSGSAVNFLYRLAATFASVFHWHGFQPSLNPKTFASNFLQILERAGLSTDSDIVIIIDSIDRYIDFQTTFNWLLDPLPVNVKVIISGVAANLPELWLNWPKVGIEPITGRFAQNHLIQQTNLDFSTVSEILMPFLRRRNVKTFRELEFLTKYINLDGHIEQGNVAELMGKIPEGDLVAGIVRVLIERRLNDGVGEICRRVLCMKTAVPLSLLMEICQGSESVAFPEK